MQSSRHQKVVPLRPRPAGEPARAEVLRSADAPCALPRRVLNEGWWLETRRPRLRVVAEHGVQAR